MAFNAFLENVINEENKNKEKEVNHFWADLVQSEEEHDNSVRQNYVVGHSSDSSNDGESKGQSSTPKQATVNSNDYLGMIVQETPFQVVGSAMLIVTVLGAILRELRE